MARGGSIRVGLDATKRRGGVVGATWAHALRAALLSGLTLVLLCPAPNFGDNDDILFVICQTFTILGIGVSFDNAVSARGPRNGLSQ